MRDDWSIKKARKLLEDVRLHTREFEKQYLPSRWANSVMEGGYTATEEEVLEVLAMHTKGTVE